MPIAQTAQPIMISDQQLRLRRMVNEMRRKKEDPMVIKGYLRDVAGYTDSAIDSELSYGTDSYQPYVPPEQVAAQQEEVKMKDTARSDFQRKLGNLDAMVQDKEGLKAAVGTNWFGRTPTPVSGDRQRFLGFVEQLVSTDSLDALIKAKANGATFGALSDTEMNILRASATKIGQWAIRDEAGKVTGFDVSEEDFNKELEVIRGLTKDSIAKIDAPVGGQPSAQPNDQAAQAKAWLEANPTDPRADKVKAKLAQMETATPQAPQAQKDAQTVQPGAQPEQGMVSKAADKIGNFLGIKKFGEGMGIAIFLKTTEGKELQKKAEEGDKIALDTLQSILDEAPNAKELIGSAALTALNIASAGTLKGVASATGAVGKIAAGSATGGAFGLAGGLEQDKDTAGVAKSTATGAVIGGVLSSVGLIKNWIGKKGQKGAERVYNSAVKPSLEDTKKAILYKGKTLGRKLLDEGIAGGDEQLLLKAETGLNKNEATLQSLLKKNKAVISRSEVLPYLEKLKERLSKTPTDRAQSAIQTIDESINLLPESFTLSEANVLKRNLYKELTDVAYKLDPKLSSDAAIHKATASALKKLIEEKSNSALVSGLNKKIATFGQLQDGVITNLARKQRNNIMGVGTIGALIEKTIGAPAVKTYGALVMDMASKKLQTLGSGAGGKITKAMILNAIRESQDELKTTQ